jgi:quinohemoprotein amine dehydrogenase
VIIGRGLEDKVDFGRGIQTTLISRLPDALTLDVRVGADAPSGPRDVIVGNGNTTARFAIYRTVDRLEVEPGYAIARLGGGKVAPVSAQFEAVGYLDTPGSPPVSLGPLPVVWSVASHGEQASRARDEKFSGNIDQTGRFLPAGAGPNPAREFSGNNVGDLFVVATVKDAVAEIQGKAHLVVTVQRWNTPPIY